LNRVNRRSLRRPNAAGVCPMLAAIANGGQSNSDTLTARDRLHRAPTNAKPRARPAARWSTLEGPRDVAPRGRRGSAPSPFPSAPCREVKDIKATTFAAWRRPRRSGIHSPSRTSSPPRTASTLNPDSAEAWSGRVERADSRSSRAPTPSAAAGLGRAREPPPPEGDAWLIHDDRRDPPARTTMRSRCCGWPFIGFSFV